MNNKLCKYCVVLCKKINKGEWKLKRFNKKILSALLSLSLIIGLTVLPTPQFGDSNKDNAVTVYAANNYGLQVALKRDWCSMHIDGDLMILKILYHR